MLGAQLRNQLGLNLADLLRVEVTVFLRDINKGSQNLLVARLISFCKDTSSTTDLHGKLLTAGVSNKLSRLLLHILSATRGLIDSLTHFLSLAITLLGHWPVTMVHCLIKGLLFESNGTLLLKGLFTNFLLTRFELSNIGVVALFCVLVGAHQDGLLFNSLNCLLLVHTAEACLWVFNTATEVHTPLHFLLSSLSSQLTSMAVTPTKSEVSNSCSNKCDYRHDLHVVPSV